MVQGKTRKRFRYLRAAGPLTAVVLGTTFVKIFHPSTISVVKYAPVKLLKFWGWSCGSHLITWSLCVSFFYLKIPKCMPIFLCQFSWFLEAEHVLFISPNLICSFCHYNVFAYTAALGKIISVLTARNLTFSLEFDVSKELNKKLVVAETFICWLVLT